MPHASTPPSGASSPFWQHPLTLALLAVLLIAPGIWLTTGITGKDEFYLGLRTPMEMMAGDHWLVPFLDGAPRIKKPPFLYWLGRLSYETLGVSLSSARLIGVLFAALLVAATTGIGRRLLGDARAAAIAGAVMLGCLGLHSEGRRFMLDVPVAALSACAFWACLAWLEERRHWQLTLAALCTAAGFLTKGPVVALVMGTGLLALGLVQRAQFRELSRHWPSLSLHLLLTAALALPWFFIVRLRYPEAADLALANEVESRQFLQLSPQIVPGLLNIALPWIFIFIPAAWQARRWEGTPRILLGWLLLSIIPFALFKSFDRYLIGSLIPLALFTGWMLPRLHAVWPWRLGMGVALILAGALAAFNAHFALGGWLPWVPFALYLGWAWWSPTRPLVHRLLAPALHSMIVLWSLFPALGINAVPEALITLGQTRPIAMINGPQPALLPILTGRAHRALPLPDAATLAELQQSGAILVIEAPQVAQLIAHASAKGFTLQPAGDYQTLASHGSGLRFARAGSTVDDWKQAWATRSLAPLMTTIVWLEIRP